jgi:hypothetical protein
MVVVFAVPPIWAVLVVPLAMALGATLGWPWLTLLPDEHPPNRPPHPG